MEKVSATQDIKNRTRDFTGGPLVKPSLSKAGGKMIIILANRFSTDFMAYAVLSLALYLIITKTYKVGITIIPILSK